MNNRITPVHTDTFYIDQEINAPSNRRPLLLGCSGGGGHNQAVEAIRRYLIQEKIVNEDDLSRHVPNMDTQKNSKINTLAMKAGALLLNEVPLLTPLQYVFSIPQLPSIHELNTEVDTLCTAETQKKWRYYIDVLLDMIPGGYYMAAIWNITQRKDDISELNNLIDYQPSTNNTHYETAKTFLLKQLDSAHQAGKAYTEIISTQAMVLSALCDAVKEYNNNHHPHIKIHQYMTDLPTKGARHFFDEITRLTDEQCQQMYLYGVGLDKNIDEVDKQFSLLKKPFAKLINIDPKDNPMVRPGFKTSSKKDNIKFKTNNKDTQYAVKPDEQVASIMLGSQASNDTITYAAILAKESAYSTIFVFGGASPHIKQKLETKLKAIIKKTNIIYLEPQNDEDVANIMTRSDLLIVRGGGLTTMEQLAMPHHDDQVLLFHSKRNDHSKRTSGISWEDENINYLMRNPTFQIKKVGRTTTDELLHDLDIQDPSLNQALIDLRNEIKQFQNNPIAADFVEILEGLFSNLALSDKEEKKTEPDNTNAKDSKAIFVAKQTTQMLSTLRSTLCDTQKSKEERCKESLRIIHHYEKTCTQMPGLEKFTKSLALVTAAACGLVLGAMLGIAICSLVGIPMTLGAIVPAIVGLFNGSFSATALGLTLGSVGTGLVAAGISGHLLFKPRGLHKKINNDVKNTVQNALDFEQTARGLKA